MRTGSEYRDALHDGRRVWVMGEANGVLRALSPDMPAIDLDGLRAIALPQRRPVAPTGAGPARDRDPQRRS